MGDDYSEKIRFRYAEVPANDFGLKIEDILEQSGKELNQKVSMKYLAPYG